MRLYIDPMNEVLVECDANGRIRLDGEDWTSPSLQEKRAILFAAENEIQELKELITVLEKL
tara:strand:- start:2144 stop:2326 length:183 start_codon:yes stop_codon:yes gene_type:complete